MSNHNSPEPGEIFFEEEETFTKKKRQREDELNNFKENEKEESSNERKNILDEENNEEDIIFFEDEKKENKKKEEDLKERRKKMIEEIQQRFSKEEQKDKTINDKNISNENKLIKEEEQLKVKDNLNIENSFKKSEKFDDTESPFEDIFSSSPVKKKEEIKKVDKLDLGITNKTESIGYYIPKLNDLINNRYKVTGVCGKGAFSSVVKVVDIISNIEYALKVIRSIDVMKVSGQREKEFMVLLNQEDKEGKILFLLFLDKGHIIRMIDSFEFNSHTCLILPLYKMNLRDLIKKTKSKGLSLKNVKIITKQLISGFIQMHKHKIIHADCKIFYLIFNS